jgi:hypothetical protein
MGGTFGAFIARIVIPNTLCFEAIAQPLFTGQRNFKSMYFYNESINNQTLIFQN